MAPPSHRPIRPGWVNAVSLLCSASASCVRFRAGARKRTHSATHRQRLEAAQDGRRAAGGRPGGRQVGEAGEQAPQRHLALHPGEGRRRGSSGCRWRTRRAPSRWPRATSKRSGSSNTAGSRLAAPSTVTTISPSATGTPSTTVSRRAIRAVRCTGESCRSTSSTAFGHSDGSSASTASWSRCAKSRLAPLEMRLTVVSNPAARMSIEVATSSCSVRPEPSSSATPTSFESRSSPGFARRLRRCSRSHESKAASERSARA